MRKKHKFRNLIYLLLCSRTDLLSTKFNLKHEIKKEFQGRFFKNIKYLYIKENNERFEEIYIDNNKGIYEWSNEHKCWNGGDFYDDIVEVDERKIKRQLQYCV